MSERLRVVVDGLAFPEGPRWHDGWLWFSDMHTGRVMRLDPDTGSVETVVEVPGRPSGLGWDRQGRLLVVSMRDRRLLRRGPGGVDLEEVADLSDLATWYCNDMVVDTSGRAYVWNFGFDIEVPPEEMRPVPALLARVDPDGSVSVAADDLMFPNGTVITPDGRTMIVAESFAGVLTAFDVDPDGSLSGRRVWAPLDGVAPDGICLDAQGAVWVADAFGARVLRVAEGGEILDSVGAAQNTYACMLGGPRGTTLFVCTAPGSDPGECEARMGGRIEAAEVEVPRAGLP